VEQAPDFHLMAPVQFGLVCFRWRPRGLSEAAADELNRNLLAQVNATRRVHLTHTELDGRFVIRMAVGQRLTEKKHVEEAWRLVREAAAAVSP
jgi:aromatic-L-amino-acid decarboxylase